MKDLLIIALLLLLIVGLIGSFSTLGNFSGGGTGSETTTSEDSAKEPSDEYPDDGIYKLADNVTFYNYCYSYPSFDDWIYSYYEGECLNIQTDEITDQVYLGYAEKLEQRLIAVSFDDLEIGKTYLVYFTRFPDYPIDFNQLYYRFGTSGSFYDFSFAPSDDSYTLVFTPTATTFQLGILFFDEAPSSQTLQTYAAAIKENVSFDLYEVEQ